MVDDTHNDNNKVAPDEIYTGNNPIIKSQRGRAMLLTPKELELEREAAKVEVAQRMAEYGLAPDTIAQFSGLKIEVINKVILRDKLTPVEESLADMARDVMSKSLAYCMTVLDTGSPYMKHQIAMRSLGAALKLIGRGDGSSRQVEEALDAMFAMQRDVNNDGTVSGDAA